MSSTSFSSYDHYNEEQYSYMLEDQYGRIMETVPPSLDTMEQPLVYYAQVQPPNVRSARKEQRKIKNYFVKAFKWYTEERPPENKRIRSAEFHGFAAWLDRKFSEYLRETEKELLQPLGTPANMAKEAECCQTNVPSSTANKRFARFRSPWNNLRSKKFAGDKPGKTTNGSCQFILQPKDLTRPVSECCYPTIAVCPNITNTTVSSPEPEKTKLKRKSQSMTSICRERAVQDFIDMIVVQEGSLARELAKYVTPCHQKCKTVEEIKQRPIISKQDKADEQIPPRNVNKQKSIKDVVCKCPMNADVPTCESIQSTSSKRSTQLTQSCPAVKTKSKLLSKLSNIRLAKADITCQCPEEGIIKFDVSTQYNQKDFETCCNSNLVCQKPESKSKYNIANTECCTVNNVLAQGKAATHSLSTFTNDGAQTSDHSIHIETGNGLEPLYFMKMICANKFNGCGCY